MKLKDYIEKNNLSVQKLSEATGIPHPTLLSYVHGKHEVSLKNALKIEKATLGAVTCEDLADQE